MTTDDISLRVGMGRLEIEPNKLVKSIKEENPFSNSLQKKTLCSKTNIQSIKCNCLVQKKKTVSIYKKKHNKILREPIFKLPHGNSSLRLECQQLFNKDILPLRAAQRFHSDNICLHTLVDNCNQLSISNKKNQSFSRTNESNNCVKWWKCETSSEKQSKDLTSERSSSCSQQALNPPCDVTIDELASYFETLVHIPKKMSSMAEMMYI